MRRIHRLVLLPLPVVLAAAVACSSAGAGGTGVSQTPSAPAPTPVAATQELPTAEPAEERFDITAHSTTDPTSVWVVVNKVHPIEPIDFRPEVSLVRGYQVALVASTPLARLLDDADDEGLGFKIASAFRSYDYQRTVHDELVASRGAAEADRVSARPGFSEHQTGLAVDLVTPQDPSCDFELCFARTPGGRWLAQHAWEYGFVIRYPAGSEHLTGYEPEPWHLRYVGRPLATAMHDEGVATLEELLHVTGGDYR